MARTRRSPLLALAIQLAELNAEEHAHVADIAEELRNRGSAPADDKAPETEETLAEAAPARKKKKKSKKSKPAAAAPAKAKAVTKKSKKKKSKPAEDEEEEEAGSDDEEED